MDAEPTAAGIIKPIIRISQRRGLGSLTLNHQESIGMLVSESGTRLHGNEEKSWFGEAAAAAEERNQPPVSSKREKMSYFRSMQQHGTDVVTVEELSRDCPPAGLSPASSPSSKYRASLPGCSPRWPHTYHHGTIFSFPSLPSSSSVSSSTSRRRRRLFYPFSSVGLLACNRYAASRRLSTVVEKPVGDASIQLASYPVQHNCAFLVGVDTVLVAQPSLHRAGHLKSQTAADTRSPDRGILPQRPLDSSPHPPGLSQLWPTTAARPVNHFASHLEEPPLLSPVCPCQQLDCGHPTVGPRRDDTVATNEAQQRQRQLSGQQDNETLATASVCQYTEHSSLGVVDLPSCSHRHHQQSAYRVDNNRTTGDFSTNRARVVSLNCCSRGQPTEKKLISLLSPSANLDCTGDETIPDAPTVDRHHRRRHQKYSVIRESTDHVLSHSNTSIGRAMDRHSSSPLATPMTSLYAGAAPTSHGANATSCASIDGQGVVATQSSSSVAHSGPIFTSRHYVNCKNHGIACKTCSCDACREHGPACSVFSHQPTEPHVQQPQATSPADWFALPHRPARSRSPNTTLCNSHAETVRDRRAYSADRPLSVIHLPADTPIAEKTSPKINSTKVERLRQLTQRLRPSSSSTSRSPFDSVRPVAEPTIQQLPPIPIAPPRHPRARSERKKSSRSKKDSATSTSDLSLPARLAPSVTPNVTQVSSLENGSVTKEEAACASIALPIPEESTSPPPMTKARVHQPQDSLFSDTAHKSSSYGSSSTNQPIPNNENDFFDEVHLTLSKLNPRIMVGTYQQRTIPFRSASFSQIDVGADGTYNRRPRTSITLKPVTYSIGRDLAGNSNSPHSASLPRRLKINDRNPEDSVTLPVFHLGEEEAKEMPSTSESVGTTDESAFKDPQPLDCSVVTKEDGHPSSDERNEELDNPFPAILKQEDRGLPDNEILMNQQQFPPVDVSGDQVEAIHEKDLREYVGQGPCLSEAVGELQVEETTENIDVTCYETTEVSVSAEIRLSPIPTVSSEAIELDTSVNLIDAELLASSKPLPVLDLLELNNHLLRLRAATRDSTLDRLADLEVAAQFGETVPVLSSSVDSSGASSRNGVVSKHGSSDQPDNRPWLSELLRLTNYERDASGWSPSDEGCAADSTECSSQPARDCPSAVEEDSTSHADNSCRPFNRKSVSFVQPNLDSDATLPPLDDSIANVTCGTANKRTPGRRNSKRRRHSSSTSLVSSSAGIYVKSSKGRSLTFPPFWSTKMCSLYGVDPVFGRASELSSLDDDDGLPVVDVDTDKFKNKHVVFGVELVNSASVTEPASPDAFTDSFQPILMTSERNALLYPKCPLAEISQLEEANDNSSPASRLTMGSSLEDDQMGNNSYTGPMPGSQLRIAGSHYASVESDEPEDCRENVLQPNLKEAGQDTAADQRDAAANSAPTDEGERSQTNHRLTVSLSVTLAPELNCANPSSVRNMSLSPYCSDLESNSFSLSPEKVQRSPLNPRRYGLKRRPLRGPYGEMLEAEMNKSEFSKMYSKRNEDLSFLRELAPRVNRDAKSSSPRPLSPQPSAGGTSPPASEPTTSNWSNITANARQNSMTLPTSHSLDDSQLKIGYNSATLPIEISGSPRHPRLGLPKRKTSANIPYELVDSNLEVNNSISGVSLLPVAISSPPLDGVEIRHVLPTLIESGVHMKSMPLPSHQRTSSSPCQLVTVLNEGGFTSEDEPDLLELTSLSSLSRSTAQLLGSESTNTDTLPVTRIGSGKRSRDTRTHAIGELYDTERSYVESLQILVTKYLQPLKGPECSGLVEGNLVDEIFFQIPAILAHHEIFLEELRKRLESWDSKQCVGGVFLDTLTKSSVIETYTTYINHWKHAKEAIKSACSAKSAFSKFLEATAREHKGKLALDSLLIMPVQRIPRYELLIKMLLKHTPREHPDHTLLLEAQREVHDLAVKINCVEREAYGAEQQQATLRELESLVEGLGPGNLATPERAFIRHDCVTIPSALGTRKERGFFLFSDLLVITSVKRRSAAIRKSSSYSTSGIASTLEANKFKLLMRVSLDDLEVTKSKEESSKRSTKDLENLEDDLAILNQITELVSSLHVSHPTLDEAIKEIHQGIQRHLNDKQNTAADPQLATLDLAISTQDGTETLSVAFTTVEKRASWEESFTETKLRLRAMSPERRPPPEFVMPLPIRKTRAGLQFTCAAPTVTWNTQQLNDVWVCNSDGYVGQVCILSLHPEPNVTSCNGVCNARITCIAAIPAAPSTSDDPANSLGRCMFKSDPKFESSPSRATNSNEMKSSVCSNFELESESSSESSGSEESVDEDASNYNRYRSNSIPLEVPSAPDQEVDANATSQPTMWLGTEDGCIHIYHCGENIRLKKNRTRIQQGAAVLCIVYMDNCVFASLANGDVLIYQRTTSGTWSINEPQCVTVGSIIGPVTRMLPVNSGLWCTSQNTVKILKTATLSIDNQFAVSSDSQRSVLSLASNGLGVWVAMQGSAVVRLFHALTHECICDVNLAPAVNKMLSGCDDIIRQHKAACLRVTSMMVCRDLLWVGTSAGVILTIPTPHLTPTSSRLSSPPCVTGLSHGHTGHVRFLTCVEATRDSHNLLRSSRLHHSAHLGLSLKSKDTLVSVISSASNVSSHGPRLLVISGGDGYEDFRHSAFSDSVGREDSTNHLLLWQV